MKSLFLYFAVCVSGAVGAETADVSIPKIPYEKYTLKNGMDVILHEDHSTPIVGVNIWYRVGSKNEVPGRTGFAHLFEHLMFQGSKHFDRDYFLPLQKAGGRVNGNTSSDRTNYWETVPSNFLELALWMESDRMAFLLPAMTQERLENQRSVVKNERRQSYENRPYGLAPETIMAAMLSPEHPYSWITIGSMADIDAASREDVANFFRRYYHPANASLCIAGDFDPAVAKRLVEKYFGPIPAGLKVEKLNLSIPELTESKRIRMTDRVGLARLYLNWPTVPEFAPDDAELEVLADILAGGKTSRLYRRLVRDEQIAQDVSASQGSEELFGMFSVTATARPGKELGALEAIIAEELQRIQDEAPSQAEIDRAVARRETGIVRSLEGISESGGRAYRLNMYNVLTGDPGYLAKDFARIRQVDPQGVQRVAKKYLSRNKVVLEVVPGKQTEITPDPRGPAAEARVQLAKSVKVMSVPEAPGVPEDADRTTLPNPGSEPAFQLPPIHRGKLSNGMNLLVVENHKTPAVSVHVTFPFGMADNPPDKLGLAGLTAAVWDEGTEKRTSEQIAEEMANIGASLSIGAGLDDTSARVYTLKRHLGKALEIFSDVLQHPSFPQAELERQRNMGLGRLVQIRNEPLALAALALSQTIYGYDHPYGQPGQGTSSSLKSITRNDLKNFHQAAADPSQATIIAVGDTNLNEIKTELEKVFSGWKNPGKTSEAKFPPPAERPAAITLIDKPGAAQSVVVTALVGTVRKTPDYFPLLVMNSALGGQFASRLNMNLREDKGYTYGATSRFDWRARDLGIFAASASIQTPATAPALTEFISELQGITGKRPVQGEELDFCKKYITRGFPAGFETSASLASQLETLVQFQLPDNYFNTVLPGVAAVTSDEISAVAKKYLKPDNLDVIIVGDRSKIEPALRELPLGKTLKVMQFDDDFRLVPAKTQAETAK
ncbi:MAG: pitrilysin family protein [Thermoguttaceae bacterium]|jgi:zinc protease